MKGKRIEPLWVRDRVTAQGWPVEAGADDRRRGFEQTAPKQRAPRLVAHMFEQVFSAGPALRTNARRSTRKLG